jgi:dimethylargininase
MSFTHAICRLPGSDFAEGITTSNQGRPDFQKMLVQHGAYVATLRSLGLEVEVLDALPGHPDAYFVEDAALMFPEIAVVTRPGALARRGEEAAMAPVTARHRPQAAIAAPGTLDGGDVLVIGKRVLVGCSERTNEAGIAQLEAILAPLGYAVLSVPVGAGLHFKSSVNWVGGNTLLVSAAFAILPELRGYDLVVVDPAEDYATNTLFINGTLITPSGFPRTRALLDTLGLPIMELDTSEPRKMDGGLTCLSWIGKIKGQNAGWRGNQRGVSRHLEGGLGA